MTKVQCQTDSNVKAQDLRVRIIKAPLVNTEELKWIVRSRAKAVVL